MTVGRRNEGSGVTLSHFVSSTAAPVPTLGNRNGHFAFLTWFRSPDLHLPLVHDVGPTAKHMSSFLGSTAVDRLNVPVGNTGSVENAASSVSTTPCQIVLCRPAFQALGLNSQGASLFRQMSNKCKLLLHPGHRPCGRRKWQHSGFCRTLEESQ